MYELTDLYDDFIFSFIAWCFVDFLLFIDLGIRVFETLLDYQAYIYE